MAQSGLFQFVKLKNQSKDCMNKIVDDGMTKNRTYKKSDGTTFDDSDIDWTEFDNMSDEEAHRRALADPDAQPLSEEQIKRFKRVNPKKRNT